jgi:hypothetical protein
MGQAQIHLENTSLDPKCAGQRYWYVFLMSSLITFFGGLLIICILRVIHYFIYGPIEKYIKRKVNNLKKFKVNNKTSLVICKTDF